MVLFAIMWIDLIHFMEGLWASSADVLNMSLAIGIGAVCFLLLFVLFYLILILRDFSYTSKHVRDTTETINTYIKTPVRVAMDVYKGVQEVMGWVSGKGKRKKG